LPRTAKMAVPFDLAAPSHPEFYGMGVPYRKLDPDVLMVQPTKHRLSFNTPVTLNGPSMMKS
jgi:hypothetical protein